MTIEEFIITVILSYAYCFLGLRAYVKRDIEPPKTQFRAFIAIAFWPYIIYTLEKEDK